MKTYLKLIQQTLIIIFLWHNTSTVQAQGWTWIKGATITEELPNYGIQGVASISNNPGARKTACTWTDTLGNLWLFGGLGYDNLGLYGRLSDLWKYDVNTNVWTWINGGNYINQLPIYGSQGVTSTSNKPSSRDHAAAVVDADGNLWLVGGYGVAGDNMMGSLNDLWKYQISTNEWTWIGGDTMSNPIGIYGMQGVADPSNVPGGRAAGVAWMDNSNNLWLMGGLGIDAVGYYGLLNDVWVYEIGTQMWTYKKGSLVANTGGVYGVQGQAATTNKPGARYSHGQWTDSLGNLWMVGGYGYSVGSSYGFLNDVWKYDVSTNNWTWIKGNNSNNAAGNYGVLGMPAATSTPGGRWEPMTWVDKQHNFWMLGGYGRSNVTSYGELNDLWKYNPQTNEWVWMSGATSVNGYGVYGSQGIYNPTNKIGARESGAIWTSKNGHLWVFGGNGYATSASGLLSDMWRYTPNNAPTLTAPSNSIFCQGTTNFSIPFSVNDLENDSISFLSIVSGSAVLVPNTLNFQWTGGSNYLAQGTLSGTIGMATILLQATDTYGLSDVDSFQLNIESTILSSSSYEICDGDSLLINGIYQFISGTYDDTLTTVMGCDSILRTIITINPISNSTTNVSICQGDTYVFGGNVLTTDGTYQETLVNSTGCDSISTLVLTINPISNSTTNVSICQGDTYAFGGTILTTDGTYQETLVNSTGCDSTSTLVLTVNPITNSTTNVSICQGDTYVFGGNVLTTDGTYQETLVNSTGCDSISTLVLTINPISNSTTNVSICQGDTYVFGGTILTTDGTYQETLVNSTGCDSISTLVLTINPITNSTTNVSICQGDTYVFGGNVLTTSGTYQETLVNSTGCDSISTLVLTVNPTTSSTTNVSICQGDTYVFGGTILTTDGTYQETLVNSTGCDSTSTLVLTINPINISSQNVSICQGYSCFFGGFFLTTTGIYQDTLVGYNGCDSVSILVLTVEPLSNSVQNATITQGSSYFFGGLSLSVGGVYHDTLVGYNGCDSISTLILTINTANTVCNSMLCTSICQGGSYFFGGMNLTIGGVYQDTLVGSTGCDSVITLVLTINQPIQTTKLVRACEGYTCFFGGMPISMSGVYQDTLVGYNGCDSISVLILNILQMSNTIQSIAICQGDSIFLGGAYRCNEGFYQDTFFSAQGCLSVVTTILFVHNNQVLTIDTTICQGDSIWAEQAYQNTEGTYYDTLTNTIGCPTILVTHLKVQTMPNIEWFPNVQDTICIQQTTINLNPIIDYDNAEITQAVLNPNLLTEGTHTLVAVYEYSSGCYETMYKTIYATHCDIISVNDRDLPYFNAYPNPSNGQFFIDFGIIKTNFYQIIIVDELGRILYEQEKQGLKGQAYEQKLEVNINHLSDGIYFARLLTDVGVLVQKIQIVK